MMSAERGAAANTLSAYERDLSEYVAFLNGRGTASLKAQVEDVRSFVADMARRKLAGTSAARKLSAVKQYHRFLLSEAMTTNDPVSVIGGPKLGRPLPKIISVEDVDKLIVTARQLAETASGREAFRALRLYCLIEVLYATGLRVSELVGLPVSAARGAEGVLTVRGKGGRERMVPLNTAAIAAMRSFLAARQADPKAGDNPRLFASHGGTGHVTRQHFAQELKGLAAAAGLAGAEDIAARTPTCVRQPSSRRRRRHTRRAADARTRRHLDDADLYARPVGTPEAPGRDPSSARQA